MKQYLGIALIAMMYPANHLFAQTDYCKRISIVKTEQTDSGYTAYIIPRISAAPADKQQAFLRKFHRRFEYILINKMDYAAAGLHQLLKDTAELNRRFCTLLTEDKQFSHYFDCLANATELKQEAYSIAEMMRVAARFFWLTNRESDGWVYYNCIGNNGQKESVYERDYSVLEAFCFEAIFSYLYKRKTPRFSIAADRYFDEIKRAIPEADRQDAAVVFAARQNLYHKMEQDTDLKDALLRYYRKYGNTFGFRLSDIH